MFSGLLLLFVGFGLRYFINRRAFNRRNAAGIEEFSSFEAATGNKFLEGVGRIIGAIMMFFGAITILLHFLVNK